MKAIIDTSSLLTLVRYYLPFDGDGVLMEYLSQKMVAGDIILIDKVLEECKYQAKGIVLKKILFLQDKDFCKAAKIPVHTEDVFPPASTKFSSMVDNNFVIGVQKNRLSEEEYEIARNSFLESADLKQITFALTLINEGQEVAIITEETAAVNDSKLFKKIPAICSILNIPVLSLTPFLQQESGVQLLFTAPPHSDIFTQNQSID